MGLYGKWLWPTKGRYITVVEGEIDALSMSQAWKHRFPVVSVPNGAQSALKSVRENLEYLNGFDTIVFMFDMDEPGQKAAKACAQLFKVGKAKIAKLPEGCKDANDCLVNNKTDGLVKAFWDAESYRPDGILDGDATWDLLCNTPTLAPVAHFFCDQLDSLCHGIRKGEIVTVCAGTKVGKSEFCKEIALKCAIDGLKVGYVALEESVPRTVYSLVGMALRKSVKYEEKPLETIGFKEKFDALIRPSFFFYNHWGSTEEENLLARLRYLRVGAQCDVIVLDHISIVVSGMENVDERRTFDNLMTNLRSFSEETGAIIVLVSHLKRLSTGTPLEEGGQTSLSLLRGSGAIGQLSDTVIGLERNQQDEQRKNITTVRLLAARYTGNSGIAGYLSYNKDTSRMTEISKEEVERLADGPSTEHKDGADY